MTLAFKGRNSYAIRTQSRSIHRVAIFALLSSFLVRFCSYLKASEYRGVHRSRMNLKMIALQINCFSSSIKLCLDPCPTDWWINWLYTTLAININQNDGITHISAFLKRSMMVSNRLYASPRSRDTSSCTETQHYPLWTISNERDLKETLYFTNPARHFVRGRDSRKAHNREHHTCLGT